MKRILSFLALSLFCTHLSAQDAMYSGCHEKKITNGVKPTIAAKSTNAIPEEDYYDVKHVYLDLKLTDTSIFVIGNVRTTAQVIVPSMNIYAFELDSMLAIDSIKLNGTTHLPFTSLGFVRKATLPSALPQGTMFNIHVYYSGTPPTGTGFFTGIQHAVAGGTHMVYTLSDPYATKDWWPAKQSLQDKIDSVDMHVTVPDYCKVGGNGLLQSTLPAGAGLLKYHWKTKYPIDYYLISLAIADYSEKNSYVHFNNSTDSMLIQNFFYDSTNFINAHGAKFDSVSLMINYFSDLIGRYPFWKEKYGHCFTTLGGGMEHQTMTTIGVTDTRTIAHELFHQWFGNSVTYNQWEDVWLSEGFATYSEQLFIENWWGTPAMKNFRTSQYNNVMGIPGGRVIVDDTTSITTLFDPRLVYRKGAAVAHMLRKMAPEDSLFFVGLRQFQSAHAYGMATTTDLKNIMAGVYGMNLDVFFDQWVYGEGYPKYTVYWSQAGPDVMVRLVQDPSVPASVPLFRIPFEIRLKSSMGDTIVNVYNDQLDQTFNFTFWNSMNGVELDPGNHILDKVIGQPINVTEVARLKLNVSPNPTADQWLIKNMEAGQSLKLVDISGRTVWEGHSKSTTIIPARQLPAGTYVLQIGGDSKNSIQLVRL